MNRTDSVETGSSLATLLVREARGEDIAAAPTPDFPEAPGGVSLFSRPALAELLALCWVHGVGEGDPRGTDIMRLAGAFGVTLSAGTVYPVLHALEGEGLLDSRTLVRSRHYTVADADAVAERLALYEAWLQWLADAARDARTDLES